MEWFDNQANEDMDQRSDIDLVRLVQEQRHRGAADALLRRHARDIRAQVGWLARRSPLRHEVDEAAQEALIAVYLSLDDVDLTRLDDTHPGRFHSFLARVVRASFLNFRRHRRREQRHDALAAATAVQAAAPGARGTRHWLSPGAAWRDEPSLAAEKQEALAGLEALIEHLSEEAQQLLAAKRAGDQARVLAAILGCSAATVRRRGEKLVAAVRGALAERQEEAATFA